MPNGKHATIEEMDLKQAYIRAVSKFADLELIAKASFKFAVDSMYGSGRGILTRAMHAAKRFAAGNSSIDKNAGARTGENSGVAART